jgi:hypothetical protein
LRQLCFGAQGGNVGAPPHDEFHILSKSASGNPP